MAIAATTTAAATMTAGIRRERRCASPAGTCADRRPESDSSLISCSSRLTSRIVYTASFPPLPRHLRADWIQGYVQDEWRVLSNLTLDVGLRYENLYKSFNNHITLDGRERLAELIDPDSRADNNNLGPRFGLAWDVRGDGRRWPASPPASTTATCLRTPCATR